MELVEAIRDRNRNNRNYIAVFVGETGAGKSWSAVRLAERIDPDFSEDKIIFNPYDFTSAISHYNNATLVFDDAGVGIGSRDFMGSINRIIGKIAQSFRYKLINLIITVPSFGFIDLQARALSHSLFYVYDRGKAVYYRLKMDPFGTWIYRKRMGTAVFRKPSRGIRYRYEDKKKEFMDAFYAQIGGGGEEKEAPPEDNAVCVKCGYEWHTEAMRPQCPKCRSFRVSVDDD